ncbi:MAG: NAD(P)/FAD-dependent oxidoreductase [Polyangiales bacterium]
MGSRPRVVIVGGGFGGLSAATELAGVDVDVVLVDRENHHLFQPLLYQVATAGLSPSQIAVPIRSIVSEQPNVHVVLDEAREVDLEKRTIALMSGSVLSFDYLVAATGAKTNYFGNDAWAKHASGLKSLRDALRIREKVLLAFEIAEEEKNTEIRRQLLTFVVIGGGPTGVEMAGAISELGRHVLAADFRTIKPEDIRVLLVEMADRVLTPFSPDLSAEAKEQLEQLGVEVRTGVKVSSIDEQGVVLGDGERIRSSVVVWATGVKPTSFAEKLGVELHPSGRVKVDASCAAIGHPNVFAVGDMAFFVPEGQERPLPGVAQVAIQQGRHVAHLIAAELRGRPRPAFRYFDKGSMATIGRSKAVVESGKLKMSGFFAWLAWCFVHVLYLIGFHNRILVMTTWIWSYLTWKRGARLITTHIAKRPDPVKRDAVAALEAAVTELRDDRAP